MDDDSTLASSTKKEDKMSKPKEINSIRIKFATLDSFKSDTLTFIPELKEDPINGEIYVSHVFCLEQSKEFNVPPFLPLDLLPGYFQTIFPLARISINPTR